jgi:predicted AlkP superfamily pyrophosphatase or phosphodiesterase
MLSGANPQRTGIISNEWRDPRTGAPVYNTGDTAYQYIDNPTRPLAGTSPRNYKVETLGDVLRTRVPSPRSSASRARTAAPSCRPATAAPPTCT